ncbi:MAG: cytochrome c-type biogenesis protein CcmH [Wenzhouxiangella sp.]|nr:MAG: cytochrome c-type biogenesis protein CcmH [Wenzhouxiangella sp.]
MTFSLVVYKPVGLLGLAFLLALISPTQPVPAQTDGQAVLAPAATDAGSSPIESFSFRSPLQERRFHGLTSNMRCLENPEQSLAESTAPQAREMRAAVFRMLQDDRADFEIRLFMVDEYGEAVLYQSAFPGHRLLLEVGPIVLLVIGLIAAFIVSMRKRRAAQ